jgi:hypothetical protein
VTAAGLEDISALATLPKLGTVRVYGWEIEKLEGHDKLKGKLTNGDDGGKNFDDDVFTCDE